MWKTLSLISIGALIGAALVFIFQGAPLDHGAEINRPASLQQGLTLSPADIQAARESNFADVQEIQDLLALPTEFARLEATHALAGRSNADRLQKLIFDGDRISERTVRDSTLTILFKRLAEVDPQTALALARIEPYSKDDGFEYAIWRIWARNNLDDAIIAVKAQAGRSYREAAAQSLYAAYGYTGNATTKRLAEELGIEPNRQTRLRFLRTLLEDSTDRAIGYISEEPSELRRTEYINWLAYAIDADNRSMALSYATRFTSASDRSLYTDLVEDRFARLNPIETLQEALATDDIGPGGDFGSALQELAAKDISAAMNFYNEIDAPQARMMAAFIIANELANSDPDAALDWVRSLDGSQKSLIEGTILAKIAESDPEFAIRAAVNLPGTRRLSAISNILMQVTKSNPTLALDLLASLPENTNKARFEEQIGQAWLMNDPTAAIAWLKTLDGSEASRIASRTTTTRLLMQTQPEAAYQLLSLMDVPQRVRSVREIVVMLASIGDISQARSLVAEFKDQAGLEDIETSLIAGLARNDSEAAVQLALQLQDDKARNQALSNIATTIAADDPARAVSLLSSISNPQSRTNAERMVIVRLARTDQAAALRMLENLDIPDDEKAKYRENIQMR